MNTDEYICAMCNQQFKKGVTDDEAWTEYDTNYPNISHDEAVLICDDCYNKSIDSIAIEKEKHERVGSVYRVNCKRDSSKTAKTQDSQNQKKKEKA